MRKTKQYVLFHGGIFSNFAGTPFDGSAAWNELKPRLDALGIKGPADDLEITRRLRGRKYRGNEQFMMSAKAWLMNDLETLKAIHEATSPKEHKALGRNVKPFNKLLWDRACEAVVTAGAIAKFSSTPRMENEILDTGDLVLVEASKYDRIWGIGLDWRDPLADDPINWKGRNLLGKCLMAARLVIAERVAAREFS